MSNGKYSCKVCSSVGRTTVFDTPQTLQIHRESKKHQESLEEIHDLKAKRAEKDAKERQKAANLEQQKLLDASASAREIAQRTTNLPGSIGFAAPAASGDDEDAPPAGGLKRKKPTEDSAAPLGSFSGYNQPQYAQRPVKEN